MTYSKFRSNPKTKAKFDEKSKSKFKGYKKKPGPAGGGPSGGGEGRGQGRKKKTKVELVFDEGKRVEFLGGFHKRKLQKKAHYRTHLEKKITVEKARIRAQAKKSVGKLSNSHRILPEVEALLASSDTTNRNFFTNSDSYEVGSATVTITSIGLDPLNLPAPEVEVDANDKNDEEDNKDDKTKIDKSKADVDTVDSKGGEEGSDDEGESHFQGNMKSLLKKSTNRLLQNSKIYKAAMRLKRKGKKCKKNPHFTAKVAAGTPGASSAKPKKADSKESKGKKDHNFRRKGQLHKTKKGKKGK